MELELKLSRSDRVYHAGEALLGEVVVTVTGAAVQHNGLRVVASGSLQMRVSEKAVGVFEAFFLNVRPIPLLSEALEVAPAGRCEEGVSCFPFSIPLRPPQENPTTPLYETYHGMNVNVQYGVAAELDRSLVRGGALATGLIEFIIEEAGSARVDEECSSSKPVYFSLQVDESDCSQPDGLSALRIEGRIDHAVAAIQRPIVGCITVHHCPVVLRSIELTLSRVEWCTVADGDVDRGIELPIHFVLPRLFTCPSINTDTWGVEFELSATAVVELHGGQVTASARCPLRLVRGASPDGTLLF